MPFQQYAGLYTKGSPGAAVGMARPEDLLQNLAMVQERSLEIMAALREEELNNPLEPTTIPHPIANTKYESLDWNIKHTMYHCGQIAMIRRAVHERFDFGLKV